MSITPKSDVDLEQVLARYNKRITALEQANPLQGGAVISGGGLTAVDPTTGHTVVLIGLGGFSDGSGRKQMRTQMNRQDGTIAFSIADLGTVPGHTFLQSIAMWDRNSRTIVSDDTVSGHGLGTPHIVSAGLKNTNTATWMATTNGSFTAIGEDYVEIQNPKIKWYFQLLADSGVTAEFQLLVNGLQVGTTQTVTSAFQDWRATNQTISVLPGVDVPIVLQARVTAGAGSARAQCYQLSGDQS